MINIITEILVITFCVFYIVGTFWKPLIINKKSLLKKILAKQKINMFSMQIDQEILKIQVEGAMKELGDLIRQIADLRTLKEEKQAELEEMKKGNVSPELKEWKDKQAEMDEIDEQGKALLAQKEDFERVIKLSEAKIGQYTKEMSLLERSSKMDKDLMKRLC
jgi:uncharacterized protein YcaQ